MPTAATQSLEVIYGAENIAVFLGLERRQVYYACSRRGLPVFRLGAILCARPSVLIEWIETQERSALDINRGTMPSPGLPVFDSADEGPSDGT